MQRTCALGAFLASAKTIYSVSFLWYPEPSRFIYLFCLGAAELQRTPAALGCSKAQR